MKKCIFACGAAATLLSMVLLAADIDGKWVLESQGQNGKQTQTLTLKAEGGKLTGSMDNQGTVVDGKVDIMDGTVDGSKPTSICIAATARRPWKRCRITSPAIRTPRTPTTSGSGSNSWRNF